MNVSLADGIVDIVQSIFGGARSDIQANTLLGKDLGFSSLDFVHLAAKIQKSFGKSRPIQFQKLFLSRDGSVRMDVSVAQLVEYVVANQSAS